MKIVKMESNVPLLKDKNTLIKEIISLDKYLSAYMLEYLISSVNIDKSIFYDPKAMGEFYKKDLFYEVMKYNLVYRTIKKIDECESIKSFDLYSKIKEDSMTIYQRRENGNNIRVYDSSFERDLTSNQHKPTITLLNNEDKDIASSLITSELLRDWHISFDKDEDEKEYDWIKIKKRIR